MKHSVRCAVKTGKDNRRYGLFVDGKEVDWRTRKDEAVWCAYELKWKYGEITVIQVSTGKVIYD